VLASIHKFHQHNVSEREKKTGKPCNIFRHLGGFFLGDVMLSSDDNHSGIKREKNEEFGVAQKGKEEMPFNRSACRQSARTQDVGTIKA
jgi:hypothetical protein